MSTVIGLLKGDRHTSNLITKLNAAGCAGKNINLLVNPRDVHALLDDKAFAQCGLCRCAGTGALIGMAFFTPVGLLASLFGCMVLNCTPLIWLFGLGGLSLIGAGFGALFGCFFGADHFERDTHLFTEGVGWGNKLIVVNAQTPEATDRSVNILQQEQALAIKVFDKAPEAR